MSELQKAPTSKLLDLIKTGKIQTEPQQKSHLEGSSEKIEKSEAIVKGAGTSLEKENVGKQDKISITKDYYKIPNIVDDQIVGQLGIPEEIIYRHMIRLSWGWNRNWCRVGTYYFQQKSSLKSRKAIRDAINKLLERGLIICHTVDGAVDRNQDGTVYIIPVPTDKKQGILQDSILPNSVLSDSILYNSTPSMLGNSVLPDSTPNENQHGNREKEGVLRNSILPDDRIKYNLKDSLKHTLSTRDIITFFYKGLGHTRITKDKRERAEKCIEELTEENFSLEDVQFAVEWTLKNKTEKLYDFSILKHTIGEAMTAKERSDTIEKQRIDEQKQALAEKEEYERLEKEKHSLDAYKESMSSEGKAKLREKALAEIKSNPAIKEEFISEMLIKNKENEILRKEHGEDIHNNPLVDKKCH